MFSFSSNLWYEKRRISKINGEVSLYLQVVINGKHDEFKLMLRWPHDRIDLVAGVLLARKRSDPDVNDYNLLIDLERSKHTEILKTYRLRNILIDLKKFKEELKIYNNKDSFIAFMHNRCYTRYKANDIVKKTYQNHMSTLMHMKNYDEKWLFKDLTIDFLSKFKKYLKEKGYEPGHIWGRIRDVKAYLELASKEPMLYVHEDIIAFSNPEPLWDTTFLNRDELRRLMIVYKDNYLKEQEQQVLSAFIFTCLTSLRISDVYRANSGWRLSSNVLSFIPKKGEGKRKKMLHIPLMPMATFFIKSSGNLYFDLPSEVEYNRILKDLAIAADIKKKLTSHVGRHTFGFLFMTTIGNLKALQEILGHSKTATTERYAHLDEEYKLDSVKRMQTDFTDLFMRRA